MNKYTQLMVSLGGEWVVAGEANSSSPKELAELKRLEWDMRNKNRGNPNFKSEYREVKE